MALLRGNIAALVAAVAPAEMHPLLVQLQAVLNIVDQINIWKLGNNQTLNLDQINKKKLLFL